MRRFAKRVDYVLGYGSMKSFPNLNFLRKHPSVPIMNSTQFIDDFLRTETPNLGLILPEEEEKEQPHPEKKRKREEEPEAETGPKLKKKRRTQEESESNPQIKKEKKKEE